ncbi:MAG: hypothetical protein KDD21_07910 [Bacteroidetes bacterium]|nr:hypothetical protein [Bacteroidota bacterium]
MKRKLQHYIKNFYYSFPIQLLVLHINKHLFVLLFWIVLFLSVLNQFGSSYGVPLLFLDPEYLGKVDFWSFLIVGFSMGGFIMAWNMSFYILNGYRFQFLASFTHPFVQFCINNFIIPIAFSVVYIVCLVRFQHTESLFTAGQIVSHVVALILGNVLMILFSILFFNFFDQDVERVFRKIGDKARQTMLGKKILLNKSTTTKKAVNQWRVDTFLNFPFKISYIRNADFYDKKLVDEILFHHHRNAIIFQILAICSLLFLGRLMEHPTFRMPASSAIFLIFSVFVVLFSFLSYWFRTWRTVILICFFFLLNSLTQFDLIVYKHKLYGLDYTSKKLTYNNEVVNNSVNKQLIDEDIAGTKLILEKWKQKMLLKYGEEKPKLIFINTAGGGLKASYWSFYLLQKLEEATGKKMFDHTVLMTGASGGMLGAAYFRELYYRHTQNPSFNYLDTSFLNDIGLDILNGMATSIATNDIFYPWQNYKYKGFTYKKDRAYMFDLKLNENTKYRMSKLLTDYKIPEANASIPMMVLGSTIINDQRFLFFAAQPIAYLIKPYMKNSNGFVDNLSTDAVEYMRFFKSKGAENINFIDALRTNATYPYIMPAVYLPTIPEIKAMDAGIRENTGLAVSTRFYSVFKDWIEQNTSGVIFISLRVDNKLHQFETTKKPTYISEFLSPIGTIFNNFLLLQNYNADISISYLENASKTSIDVLNFNYDQSNKRKKASMSWHLTNGEKRDIKSAYSQENNVEMLEKLKALMH